MGKELFDNIPSKVSDLLSDVKNGRIGLPDLQRPFVWKDNKVRELLDSMMKGYPIGYVMLWSCCGHLRMTMKIRDILARMKKFINARMTLLSMDSSV